MIIFFIIIYENGAFNNNYIYIDKLVLNSSYFIRFDVESIRSRNNIKNILSLKYNYINSVKEIRSSSVLSNKVISNIIEMGF